MQNFDLGSQVFHDPKCVVQGKWGIKSKIYRHLDGTISR